MASSLVYITAAICTVVALFLYLKSSLDRKGLMATPNIPIEKVTITSYASSTILAKPEKVFEVLMNHDEYAKWSSFKDYKWHETTEDGIPVVGSKGSFLVSFTFPCISEIVEEDFESGPGGISCGFFV